MHFLSLLLHLRNRGIEALLTFNLLLLSWLLHFKGVNLVSDLATKLSLLVLVDRVFDCWQDEPVSIISVPGNSAQELFVLLSGWEGVRNE